MEEATTWSSGSVVFSLPHLREAVFFHHAHHLVQERERRLREIDRVVQPTFQRSFSSLHEGYTPERFFASKLHTLSVESNILNVLQVLGLHVASYLDLIATRTEDVAVWLSAVSTLGGSRKWLTPNGRSQRLEALPKAQSRNNILPETARSNAIEMLYHGSGGRPYSVSSRPYGASSTWAQSEGLAQVLKDHAGRLYLARILDISYHRFPFVAARERPELLYSSDSPFLPHYDVVTYEEASHVGLVITQCPPWPLSQHLAPAQPGARDELRRVLERMHDLFAHLVFLQNKGVSLNGKPPVDGWISSFLTARVGPWFVPAYLERISNPENPSRLAASALYEERLPQAPSNAWPVAPFEGAGGLAGLPWSQVTAYSDQRVKGPRTFLHGVFRASFDDADQTWKDRRVHYHHIIKDEVRVVGRYHSDLINFTDCILHRFFPAYDLNYPRLVRLLEEGLASKAYEDSIANGADSGPCDPTSGHSGLFSFCVNCFFKDRRGKPWRLNTASDKCNVCTHYSMASAMPKAIEDLLLRIIKPELNSDGTSIIVTAQEALATIKSVMDIELPRMIRVYELWVQKQKPVQRMTTVAPLPLDKIRGDASADRWTLFELLRGNYSDAKFTRQDRKETRDLVKAHLDAKKKQEAEAKAEEAQRQAAAAAAASSNGNEDKLVMTAAEEAELLQALLTATYADAKRGAEGEENEGDTAAKRVKMT